MTWGWRMDLDERMRVIEQKMAVQSQITTTHREELNIIFEMFRRHMEKEEEQREELIRLIAAIKDEQSKQKSFWGGIVFAISAAWAIGIVVWQALHSGGQSG